MSAARLHEHALLKESDLGWKERLWLVIGRWDGMDMEEWDVIATSRMNAIRFVKEHQLSDYDPGATLRAKLVW